jgi:uncharacterized protein YoaH (UPF0181 family)
VLFPEVAERYIAISAVHDTVIDMDIEEIRELARKFTPGQIDGCITQQIETGENICLRDESTEKIVNELSKAQFVRELMAQGMSMPDAIRELARRIRRVQKGFEGQIPEQGKAKA